MSTMELNQPQTSDLLSQKQIQGDISTMDSTQKKKKTLYFLS